MKRSEIKLLQDEPACEHNSGEKVVVADQNLGRRLVAVVLMALR